MNQNKKIMWGVVSVIVLVAIFYGGVVYGKGHATTTKTAGAFTRGGAQGAGGTRGGMGGFAGGTGGVTTGSIISKDGKSITVSIMGGGSKIIFFDTNTKVSKTVAGLATDLVVGSQVVVSGTANSDGSLNATTVQIRPNMPPSAKVQ